MKTLWNKGKELDQKILDFTVGNDREIDSNFIKQDIMGSIGHILTLKRAKIISESECYSLSKELIKLYDLAEKNSLRIESDDEDVHSMLEKLIIYHENVLFELKQFFSIYKLRIQKQGKSSGRPKGSSNKLTIKKYNWVRNKYYFLKNRISSSTRKEKAELIRSKLLENPPDWWDKHIYSIETIMDIIKKKKWGK